MANCINYDCNDPLGEHTLNECGEEVLGGGSGAILFECNTQLTDPTNATQIQAEIAAGRATLIQNVKIGLNDPEPIQVDSNIVGATQKLVSYNRSGTLIDGNVNNPNVDFYNGVFGGRVFGSMLIYIKGTEENASGTLCSYIDAPVTFTGGYALPNNNDVNMFFSGTFNWRKKNMPALPDAPVGIFS